MDKHTYLKAKEIQERIKENDDRIIQLNKVEGIRLEKKNRETFMVDTMLKGNEDTQCSREIQTIQDDFLESLKKCLGAYKQRLEDDFEEI